MRHQEGRFRLVITKATYHNSWPNSKSPTRHLPFKHEYLHDHGLFPLAVLMVDTTDLHPSKFSVPPLGFNQCLHTMCMLSITPFNITSAIDHHTSVNRSLSNRRI